jgi:uncharacterized membrane protein YfcA
MFPILILIGLIGGILTGMMSVGGGIILVFLLILIPPLFDHTYTMHDISGMLIIYTIFSMLSGVISYYRHQLFDRVIAYSMGIGSFAGGVLGGALASIIGNRELTFVFALLSLVSVFTMFWKPEQIDTQVNHNKKLSASYGLGIGTLGGMFGLGAGFLYVPVLLKVFKLQPKQAVGTGLALGISLVLGALMVQGWGSGFPWVQGLALAIGGVGGAQIGSALGRHMNPIHLRRLMAFAITMVAIKIWIDVFTK